MLSVCIPVFERDMAPLVGQLLSQMQALSVACELVLADDGSSDSIRAHNLEHCPEGPMLRWLIPTTKMGRAGIRNFLGQSAQGDWLLFMDCDALVCRDDFLETYVRHFEQADVLVGGTAYVDDCPSLNQRLRWHYGRQREVRPAAQRNQCPYKQFVPFNFAIKKEVFLHSAFDESQQGYGHEDSLFGLALKTNGFSLLHIDNPLIHDGLTDYQDYIANSLHAVEKFIDSPVFKQKEVIESIRILSVYHRLKQWHLQGLLVWFDKRFSAAMHRQLCGKRPNLYVFDAYRLCHLARYDKETPLLPTERPLVSIIIPVYNRAETLLRTLHSVRRQSYRPLELILVDNASRDDSLQVCQDFAQEHRDESFSIIVSQENSPGANAARNTGFTLSTGDFVGFFDDDDEMDNDRIERLIELQAKTQAPMVASRGRLDDGAASSLLLPKRMASSARKHLCDSIVCTHCFLVERSLLLQVGPWNETLDRWQDWEYGYRLLHLLEQQGKRIAWHRKALYTIHQSAQAISSKRFYDDAEKIGKTLNQVYQQILQNDHPLQQHIKAWCFKKVATAAVIWHEHPHYPIQDQEAIKQLADQWFSEAIEVAPLSYRFWLNGVYAYGKRGGRGAWRLT